MAFLYELHIEAGFRGDDFFTLSPRRLFAQLKAAQRKTASDLANLTEAQWIATNCDHKGLLRYTAALRGEDTALPPEAMAAQLNAASASLPTITLAQYHAQRK